MLPARVEPKFDPSSSANTITSRGCLWRSPLSAMDWIASRAPRVPTIPSYMPPWRTESIWEPDMTEGASSEAPASLALMLPTPSVTASRPASLKRPARYSLALMSWAE